MIAEDIVNEQAIAYFNFTISNKMPRLDYPFVTVHKHIGSVIDIIIPEKQFIDDEKDQIFIQAFYFDEANNKTIDLPNWLSFFSLGQRLYGTTNDPKNIKLHKIIFLAKD